jgi:hypothetical protein
MGEVSSSLPPSNPFSAGRLIAGGLTASINRSRVIGEIIQTNSQLATTEKITLSMQEHQ